MCGGRQHRHPAEEWDKITCSRAGKFWNTIHEYGIIAEYTMALDEYYEFTSDNLRRFASGVGLRSSEGESRLWMADLLEVSSDKGVNLVFFLTTTPLRDFLLVVALEG